MYRICTRPSPLTILIEPKIVSIVKIIIELAMDYVLEEIAIKTEPDTRVEEEQHTHPTAITVVQGSDWYIKPDMDVSVNVESTSSHIHSPKTSGDARAVGATCEMSTCSPVHHVDLDLSDMFLIPKTIKVEPTDVEMNCDDPLGLCDLKTEPGFESQSQSTSSNIELLLPESGRFKCEENITTSNNSSKEESKGTVKIQHDEIISSAANLQDGQLLSSSSVSLSVPKEEHTQGENGVRGSPPIKESNNVSVEGREEPELTNHMLISLSPSSTLTGSEQIVSEDTSKPPDPSFECTTCGKTFHAKANLVKHILVHEKRHLCDQCPRAFRSSFKLKEHYRVHTKDYPFGCTECERTYRISSSLTAHIRRDHKGIKVVRPKLEFPCEICHKVLHSKDTFKSHAHTHREQNTRCQFCQEIFTKTSILVRHIRIAHDSKFVSKEKETQECPVCSKTLHRNSMKTHLRIHKGEKPFPCPVCPMKFRTYAHLTSHSWSHTNDDKPFKCKKCPKSYVSQKILDNHVMVVHEQRTSQFTCKKCGVKLASKANLKRHINDHLKQKEFECKTCGKCFPRKDNLSAHEKTHSNVKPFTCSICGKMSRTKSNHSKHLKIHEAQKSRQGS